MNDWRRRSSTVPIGTTFTVTVGSAFAAIDRANVIVCERPQAFGRKGYNPKRRVNSSIGNDDAGLKA